MSLAGISLVVVAGRSWRSVSALSIHLVARSVSAFPSQGFSSSPSWSQSSLLNSLMRPQLRNKKAPTPYEPGCMDSSMLDLQQDSACMAHACEFGTHPCKRGPTKPRTSAAPGCHSLPLLSWALRRGTPVPQLPRLGDLPCD